MSDYFYDGRTGKLKPRTALFGGHPLMDIPNVAGFLFTGILRTGERVKCIVNRHEIEFGGGHYIAGGGTIQDLVAWEPRRKACAGKCGS